jgi:ubiquinone/menaquinone biosynthesis C-methylase UbiE
MANLLEWKPYKYGPEPGKIRWAAPGLTPRKVEIRLFQSGKEIFPAMNLNEVQRASQEQFARQSERYGKGHILENVEDVRAALEHIALPSRARVLDVATGGGHTGLLLASLGHDVTLSDLTQSMLDRAAQLARERGLSVSTRLHAAESFPYEAESFDLVTCRVAAHHFSAPDSFVRETARVLKRDGWFLLIDGTVQDDQAEAEEWSHAVEKLRDPSHHRFITPRIWRGYCEASGLQVIHSGLTPFKQPDLNWYFDTAATSPENRRQVLKLVQHAPESARKLFQLGEEDGKIVWWWQRLTLVARKG